MFNTPFPKLNLKENKAKIVGLTFKSLVYAFAIFGVLFMLFVFGLLNMLKDNNMITPDVPENAVLNVDFDEVYTEMRVDDLFSEIAEVQTTSFYDLIKAINLAALDKRIKVLKASISSSNLGLAQIEELRATIMTFRALGKKTYIHSTGFAGSGEYYLATAFDEISMQPNTEIGLMGVGIEVPFVKGLFEKIGVEAEFYTRYEYKSAVASLTDKGLSPAHKAEYEKLGHGIFDEMLSAISLSRGISVNNLKGMVDKAPIFSDDALKNKLIDKIAYQIELTEKIAKENKAEEIDLADYSLSVGEAKGKLPKVAFLVIDGVISDGASEINPLQGENIAGSKTILAQVKEISEEKNLKALVVRVNSPGGSYTASNEIWHAIAKLKADKKIPVVVSMGDVAASGGYFVALSGDYVLAEPLTITGSIGVLGGKIVLQELWKKLGVNWASITIGKNAGMYSSNAKFSVSEREVFNRSLDNVYKDFTGKVSGARGIDLDSLDKLARGRIWLGKDAAKNGLVDGLGGIDKAIALAKERGGIRSNQKFNIVYYPKPKTFSEKVSEVLGRKKVSATGVLSEFGLDLKELNMLKRMQYDAVLMPMVIKR